MTHADMPAPFVINHGSYPFDVLVCIGNSDEEVISALDDLGVSTDEKEREFLEVSGDGRTVLLEGGQTVLRIRKIKEKAYFHAILAHEVHHAVAFLFNRIGITHNLESDEAWAYQTAHLLKQIYRNL